MKLRLILGLLSCSCLVHAEEADKQSMYQISSTDPLTITSTSVRTPLLPNTTGGVRIAPSVDVHCKAGGIAVVATVSDTPFWGKSSEYMKIQKTDGNYVACIRDSADGKVWVDPTRP